MAYERRILGEQCDAVRRVNELDEYYRQAAIQARSNRDVLDCRAADMIDRFREKLAYAFADYGDDRERIDRFVEAEERIVSFIAALKATDQFFEREELWKLAVEDGQFESDLDTLFGPWRSA